MKCLNPKTGHPHAQEFHSSKAEKTCVHLTHDEIISHLPVYRPDDVYLEQAEFDGKALRTQLQKFDYPFTKFPLDYVPGTYAVLYVCQAAYLLGAMIVRWDDTVGLTPEEYHGLMLAEQVVFTGFSFKFRIFVPNDGRVNLEIWAKRTIKFKGKILTSMEFSFAEGIHGSCRTVIAKDCSINRPWSEAKSLPDGYTKEPSK